MRPTSVLERTIRVLDVSHELRSKRLLRFTNRLFREAVSEAKSGDSDKEDFIDLIASAESHGRLDEGMVEQAVAVAKTLVTENLDTVSDFKVFAKFQMYCDRWLTPDEQEAVREKFDDLQRDKVGDYLRGYESSDPDEIREFADELSEIGDDVGVNTAKSVEKLKEYAEKIEDQAETDEDADEKPKTKKARPISSRTKSKDNGDAEINSLFDLMEF